MNHLKLRHWTLETTVDLGFAVCDSLVSDFYVYLCIVLSNCYHWWICLLVWFLSSFFLLLFYIFNNFFIFYFNNFIPFYLIFLSLSFFFLTFLLRHVADRVLVSGWVSGLSL